MTRQMPAAAAAQMPRIPAVTGRSTVADKSVKHIIIWLNSGHDERGQNSHHFINHKEENMPSMMIIAVILELSMNF